MSPDPIPSEASGGRLSAAGDPDQPPVGRPRRGRAALARFRQGVDAVQRFAAVSRSRPNPAALAGAAPARGIAFEGTIWLGGSTEPEPGVLVLDSAGRVAELRRSVDGLPDDLPVLGDGQHWVMPGLVDAHVHLGFDPTAPPDPYGRFTVSGTETGLVGVRDLGAPMPWASRWRTGHRPCLPGMPFIAVSGPILTAAGGYPSRSWGADGYAEFVSSPAQARWVVQRLAADGVDLIKLALEPGGQSWPVPEPRVVRAIVEAAHSAGLPTVAHALTVEMVSRAVDAGVDELAHTPTERLPAALVERIAAADIRVTSTLQTFFTGGEGRDAAANAADLVSAGVRLSYGTDLGNSGTRPGVDPRELDRLAAAGLGRLGALRSATEWSANVAGMRQRSGLLAIGRPAALVLLPGSPLVEPGVFRTPSAVYVDGRLTVGAAS
jgi:imidazolonepropionase-like amidohydrolase